ncbi:hypothetical protein STSP2_02927 [Anaerohalosphaera lusitana]|uniref:Uncharacterized protein n=1 Tax=Anaerohalosphaera lusitana TaxID=1936003 RepID=A0A1U9NP86_9BACT|nr:hypothetical protein STSP2_02927 [Anaerohalosphaera lusitana]
MGKPTVFSVGEGEYMRRVEAVKNYRMGCGAERFLGCLADAVVLVADEFGNEAFDQFDDLSAILFR